MFIPDPVDFLPIPDPVVKKAPDPGFRIRNAGLFYCLSSLISIKVAGVRYLWLINEHVRFFIGLSVATSLVSEIFF